MFTASALRNMDPALEEAAEVSGASALRILFTVTFPLIAPAIISGMLLSFIVMLGIYGIPAVLGTPGDIPVLTTYIFKLTNWSPPLYSHRRLGRDHPDDRHRLPGLAAAAGDQSGAATSRSPARRSAPRVMKLGALALFHARRWRSSTCSSWWCCRRWR